MQFSGNLIRMAAAIRRLLPLKVVLEIGIIRPVPANGRRISAAAVSSGMYRFRSRALVSLATLCRM